MPLLNVPLPGQTLNATRDPIANNFTTISTGFAVNHVDFNVAGVGKHIFVTMPVQAADPSTAAAEMALYTKSVAGTPQLFLRQQTNGTVIPLTSATASTNGMTTLPSGIIIMWGQTNGGTLIGNAWTTVTFPTPFPNNCFSIQLTPKVVTAAPSQAQTTTLLDLNSTFTVANFQVFNRRTDAGGGINADCTYFAIGN